MDRNREARRVSMPPASANGLSRRRHRSNSLRDSPEEDGPVELHEPARLRDRGVKKDRDHRDRDRDRDRDRERDRDRSSRSKRRRGDRLIHGSNREDGGEDSSEESVNDEEDDEDDDGAAAAGGGGAVRMLPPNPAASMSSSLPNHHHQHRKNFPPSATTKSFSPAPGWKPADEMIGFTVPRKARTASTKRSHEYWVPGNGVGAEQIHRQASNSPVRPSLASTSTPPAAPISPSSSNASVRKKMKPNGPKPRPPKSSSKSLSSNPEELEIEIAEVLYGLMTQSQGPSKKEIVGNNNDSAKFDSREVNKSSSDAKSRVSSPISNSTSTAPQSSSAVVQQNSSSSPAPISAVAPKRKRPRPVSDSVVGGFSARNSPISSSTTATMKVEIDQAPKTEISSPNLEKNPGSTVENGHDFAGSQAVPPSSEPSPRDSATLSESKPVVEESRETRDVGPAKDSAAAMVTSPKKESGVVKPEDDREDTTATKANQTIPEIEIQREEKFQIDLMAPPPQSRSSPEREAEVNFVVTASEHKPARPEVAAEVRPMMSKDKEDEKAAKGGGDEAVNVAEPELKKAKATVEEAESEKPPPVLIKERNIDLHLDLEKTERDSSPSNKLHPHTHKHHQQQQQQLKIEQPLTEKTAQPNSLPLPMSVASWPGGLPPMGYMAPLQGVVSMDASRIPSTPIQTMFSQPRSKRCATHCYIARNIHYLQQCMKMNPFWSAAGSAASLFGAKPCNLNVNVVPSAAELHGNIGAGRSVVNSVVHEKGQGQGGLAIFPGHSGKDKGGSQAANIADTQRKQQQILLQQALPPGASPNNILHGPAAFIFPMNQQQVAAAAAASVRPGSAKSPAAAIGSVASSTTASNSASVNGSAPPGGATVSFNYPNMPASETQYLAILQNNAYPFPVPAVGAPPTYRGTHAHAQAMPFFNGSFYSSQMIHPSQLQQQQQQQHANTQPQQMQQGHQNTSISSGSSSSQKHLQSQQQRPQGSSSTNGGTGNGNLHSFPAPKNHRASQSASQQQQTNQHLSNTHQSRQIETEVGGEDSPLTAASDGRVSRATMSMYGQNFAVPIHHQNFALMTTPPSAVAAGGANGGAGHGHQGEKKQQQQQSQQQALKAAGVEYLPQTFAMSFASINDATTMASGIDMSSMAQNHHTVLQGHPEAANRHNYQMMAAQQKKNFRISVEGKTGGGGGGGDTSSMDEEKKGGGGNKVPTTVGGQSIIFSRPLTEASVSAIQGSVIDSSTRTLNLVSAPPPQQSSRSAMPNAMGSTVNASNSQLQTHLQYHQQHLLQMQKHQHQHQQQLQQQQQLGAAAAARNKTPATSNGSVYSDHLNSSSPSAAKFTNATLSSAFPQNLVQSSSSSSNNHPSQSHQWKNSSRATITSQVPSSLASSTTSSLKNLTQQQQQARTQQSHTQISFGASQKSSSTVPQGQQQGPNSHSHSHQSSASPPMVVGSPTTSISKGGGASGSPRTSTSTSQPGNKPTAQPSSLSSQQPKNSTSVPSRKSSPVGVRNVPSILGNPHIASSSTGTKSQIQQQLPKQMVQQQQLFFSAPYLQTQGPHSTGGSSNAAVTSGYYIPRRRPEQQSQHSPATSSTGMLSLCPPATLSSTSTSDAKAAAAVAASNMKGLHAAQFAASQSSGNSHQLLPPGFSYSQAVPTAVQVKPAEQKQQPAGE